MAKLFKFNKVNNLNDVIYDCGDVKNAYWLNSMHISTEISIIDLYGQDQWTRADIISDINNRNIRDYIDYSKVTIYSYFGIKTKLIIIGPEEELAKTKFMYKDCFIETINYDEELKFPTNSSVTFDDDYNYMLQKAREYDEDYERIFNLIINTCKVIRLSERRNRRSFIDQKNHFDNLKLSKYYSVSHDDDDWDRGEYSALSRSITLVRK